MRCRQCGFEETKVLESRVSLDGNAIRRRRCCRKCDARYTTYEKEEQFSVSIKKKDQTIEPYVRGKVLRSLQVACRKRSISTQDLDKLIYKLEASLQEKGDRIVESSDIGNLIMENLYQVDPVAYIRFVSVYKDFKDPQEFYSILNRF